MFTGYHFFDYKYNIPGYEGQDFDGPMRFVYMISCFILIPLLCVLFRKTKHEKVSLFLKIISILMPILEITKITWESYWDIKTGRGFNYGGILSLETCSLFMYTLLVAAWGKGKAKDCCLAWLSTLGIAGGLSNILFIQGLKYYPFFTFGGMYSMFWHFMMGFVGVFIIATGYKKFEWKDIFKALIPHYIFACLVIPLDYIFKWNYSLYRYASGVPFLSDFTDKLADKGMCYINTMLMIGTYFVISCLIISVIKLGYLIKDSFQRRKKNNHPYD